MGTQREPLVQGEAEQGRGQRALASGQTCMRSAMTAMVLGMEAVHCAVLSMTHLSATATRLQIMVLLA